MPPTPRKQAAQSPGKRLVPQRRQELLELIIQNRRMDVNEISEQFGVSKVTARADLDYLASQHLIERARGGALISSNQSLWANFSERALLNRDAKVRIALKALQFLVPRETIILDGGSTLYEFSRCISIGSGLTVVTPALNIAVQLANLENLEVIVVGGRFSPSTVSSIGPVAERQLQDVPAHKVFLATYLIDSQGDLADVSIEAANLKRAMIGTARQVILLADSTKWSIRRPAMAKVAPLSAVDTVVTDAGMKSNIRRAIRAQGVEVVIA